MQLFSSLRGPAGPRAGFCINHGSGETFWWLMSHRNPKIYFPPLSGCMGISDVHLMLLPIHWLQGKPVWAPPRSSHIVIASIW